MIISHKLLNELEENGLEVCKTKSDYVIFNDNLCLSAGNITHYKDYNFFYLGTTDKWYRWPKKSNSSKNRRNVLSCSVEEECNQIILTKDFSFVLDCLERMLDDRD